MSATPTAAAAPRVAERMAGYAATPATATRARTARGGVYQLSPVERSQLVKRGVPAQQVVALSAALGLPREQLMRVLGLARSTVERKIAARDALSQADGEKLIGLERLIGQVDALVREGGGAPPGFDAARWFARWMAEPVAALGGLAPQALLDTADGREAVGTLLLQMQYGVYA